LSVYPCEGDHICMFASLRAVHANSAVHNELPPSPESFGLTAPAHSPNVTPKERPFAVSRPFAGLPPMIRIFAVPAAPQDGRAA
jgi:hypothetical protein